ncbi:NAD-dependent epimerase/dehydratase family protein [Renibacterium salmoninarum]|uniref:NAD-dependent epimerase/dehydratase family protein n=1 Tax=Renibacterium salmoninarum TaxID=1646 RepID=UPI000673DB67|nr:NAD-dependent epimerase/dehydratase family protein [Renibacterium salmoninarum]
MKVLVTGASGFVGQTLVSVLRNQGNQLRYTVRSEAQAKFGAEHVVVPDFRDFNAWPELLDGIDAVIHLAARVHQMNDDSADPLNSFRATNTAPTLALAQAAHDAGVSRFIFLSSIKVNGEKTTADPFSISSMPYPVDPYAMSKYEAEEGLAKIAADGAMSLVAVRSPMVYGPAGKGNVERLAGLARRGLPVPFGAIHNRRTMISVQNLSDLLAYLVQKPADSRELGLVLAGDAQSSSTAELYRELATSLGAPARILSVPVSMLRFAGRLLGKSAEINRLTESLEISVGSTESGFDWQPPLTFSDGIALMKG